MKEQEKIKQAIETGHLCQLESGLWAIGPFTAKTATQAWRGYIHHNKPKKLSREDRLKLITTVSLAGDHDQALRLYIEGAGQISYESFISAKKRGIK